MDLETTAIHTLQVHEERDPNWTDWSEEYARNAAWKRAKELYNIRGTYQENKDTFFRPKLESGATSRSRIDLEERLLWIQAPSGT